MYVRVFCGVGVADFTFNIEAWVLICFILFLLVKQTELSMLKMDEFGSCCTDMLHHF